MAAWKQSGYWPIDLDHARGFQPTTPGPPKHAVRPDTPGRMKQIAAEIEAEIPISLKDKFQACTDFMIQKVTKYRDIEKRSATLMQLRGGITVKPAANKAYVGKGRVLTENEVEKGIAKLVKRKEDEQAATKKLADKAKVIRDAEYQAACEATLAGGLPKPKRPRVPAKPKALGGVLMEWVLVGVVLVGGVLVGVGVVVIVGLGWG